MPNTAKAATIAAQLEPVVAAAGLYLEDVRLKPAGRHTALQVVVDLEDGPGGLTQDQLLSVTRQVSQRLDEADPLAGSYTLEVTTPGVDRPLTQPRHFRRAAGRMIQVTKRDETVLQGTLIGSNEDEIQLKVAEQTHRVAVPDIVAAQMVVTF